MTVPLDLIPVLDLMGGQVVRARAGRRDEYRALESVLCRSSRPEAVLDGLLGCYPFRRLYVADLDAILQRGDHRATLERLRRSHPELELWVDAGFADLAAAQNWQASGLGRAVLGSESVTDVPESEAWRGDGILSLDFRGDQFIGPDSLLQAPAAWPAQVIVMTLARVGAGLGPDLARLAQLQAMRPDCRLYAAGGVRHADDLNRLAESGVAGVLLASALHDGALSRAELAAFHAPASASPADPMSAPGRDR